MSAFRRHGIEHLSPSSLNCWRETPGLWCLRYLLRVRDDGSAPMWRGNAVERGLEFILRGNSLEDAQAFAIQAFEASAQGELTEEMDAERKRIPAMVARCLDWHKANPVAPLAATQLKIETRLDGVSVPVIGFCDFTFMEGNDVDCKSTKACPSQARPDHVRQVALYWQARNRPQSLLYVTDKRFACYAPTEDDMHGAIADLTGAARSLEQFLSRVDDPQTAIRMMPHPTEHYAYSGAAKAKLLELAEAF